MCLEKCTKFSSQFKQSHNCFSPAGRFLFSKGQWVNVLGLVGHIRSGQTWPWAIACQYLYLDSHHFLECRSVVRLASYFPHRWIKIHTVEDQDKLKLQTFTASSTILLSEIGFLFPFFFFLCRHGGKACSDKWDMGVTALPPAKAQNFASCQGIELVAIMTFSPMVQMYRMKKRNDIMELFWEQLWPQGTSEKVWGTSRGLQATARLGDFFCPSFPSGS